MWDCKLTRGDQEVYRAKKFANYVFFKKEYLPIDYDD